MSGWVSACVLQHLNIFVVCSFMRPQFIKPHKICAHARASSEPIRVYLIYREKKKWVFAMLTVCMCISHRLTYIFLHIFFACIVMAAVYDFFLLLADFFSYCALLCSAHSLSFSSSALLATIYRYIWIFVRVQWKYLFVYVYHRCLPRPPPRLHSYCCSCYCFFYFII